MPNCCYNQLCITGMKQDIEEFFDSLKGKPAKYADSISSYDYSKYDGYSFNALVPVPDAVLKNGYSRDFSSDYEECDIEEEMKGYTWQTKYWGTKWDAFAHEQVTCEINTALSELKNCKPCEQTSVSIYFRSAYSPPAVFFEQAAAQFPSLNFRLNFAEYLCNFSGYVEFDGGELVGEEVGPCQIEYID